MADRLTPEFLQQLLAEDEPSLAVTQVLVKPGSGRGDNYTAMLYRVNVKGFLNWKQDTEEQWERSLIYKCLPSSTERREAYRSDVLFNNEVAFYTQALPALLDFQRSHAVESSSCFRAVPRCYMARHDLLLLEDLRDRGFVMLDRKSGLDATQCAAVLRELAKFHALSLAMRSQNPREFQSKIVDNIREVLFVPENQAWYKDYYAAASRSALASVRDSLSPKYVSKLSSFTEDVFSRMTSLVSSTHAAKSCDAPVTLCHGDCWTNNILFRFDHVTQDIAEVCLLDFQLARVGSPALDLANLLYCCTSRDLRDQHLDSLLLIYHQQLTTSLEHLGSSDVKMTLPVLRCEMNKYAAFGLGLALDMIPITTCDSTEAPDLYNSGNGSQGNTPGTEAAAQAGCELLQVTPTALGKRMMVELVQELVDLDLI